MSTLRPEEDALRLMSPADVHRYRCIPLRRQGSSLIVAMADPKDLRTIQNVEFLTGLTVDVVESSPAAIDGAVFTHYRQSQLPAVIRERKTALMEPPVVRIQKLVFSEAVRLSASDIHIEPGDRLTRIRFRVDGLLQDAFEVPGWLHDRLLARIKIMARLDISERRRPQDGHLTDRERGLEARLSTLPTHRGEAAVIRLFGDRSSLPTLTDLGCGDLMEQRLRALCHRPQGILLIVGPTGSGKTTTLYAIIDELRSSPLNIVTIEDPIEYRVDGVRQVQVDDKSGLSFQASLRSTLRQDPDVILVGEIRDGETARIAFNAALTGHLVLTTLHATDAASAGVRLVELGVDRYLISSAMIGVIAQRLVRKNCSNCLRPDFPPALYGERLGLDPEAHGSLRRSYGCIKCNFSCGDGRVPLFEMLEICEEIRPHIASGRKDKLLEDARRMGFVSLLDQAIELVLTGMCRWRKPIELAISGMPDETESRLLQGLEPGPRCHGRRHPSCLPFSCAATPSGPEPDPGSRNFHDARQRSLRVSR